MKPKQISALLLVLGLMTDASVLAESAPAPTKPHAVSVKEIDEGNTVVLGELGLPLLTAVEIVATVEDELLLLDNSPTGRFLLKVESVNGTKLKNSVTMKFTVQSWSNATVAEDTAALDQRLKDLQWQAKDPDLDSALRGDGAWFSLKIRTPQEAQQFRDHYLGSRHRLVVFEVLLISGKPKTLPADCVEWSNKFNTNHHLLLPSLVVMAERKL